MSVGGYDVEINGVGYMLAEDAEGIPYSAEGSPLRPPNAVTVQGEGNRQVFQMRPDAIKWTLTDWSGGAGQEKFSFTEPNRWRELSEVRAFDKPGRLLAGWSVNVMEDSGGPLVKDGPLVIRAGTLFMLDDAAPNLYQWNSGTEQWSVTALTGPAGGASRQAAADQANIYWHETGTDNVWKWASGSTATQIDSAGMGNFTDALVTELGGYVYVYSPSSGQVWEISKAGSSETLIDDFGNAPGGSVSGQCGIITMNGKIYLLASDLQYTAIREIVPTTAAGTGFGREIARFNGFYGQALWQHSGTLYVVGRYGDASHATVMYVIPEQSYGSLGKIETAASIHGSASEQNGRMLTHYFGLWDASEYAVYEIDAVSGGYTIIARQASIYPIKQAVAYTDQGVFVTTDTGTTKNSYWVDSNEYSSSGYAISPWHDFDLADEKLLSSVVLAMEDLPADWQVQVDYAIDGVDTWTNIIDISTENSNGTKVAVSTDTTTVKFHTLSIRVRLTYNGVGAPTTTPEILGIDANAMVAKKVTGYRLVLDLDDDEGRISGNSGYRKAQNIKTAAATEGVISFKDGYESATPGKSTEYDMVIDRYQIINTQPGQGIAMVEMTEPV